jgi:hypothetical protein
LFFSISQELKNASLNVNDLRTLRLYYNYNKGDINNDVKKIDDNNIENKYLKFDISRSDLEVACEIAANRIFGLNIEDLPILLIPVSQLTPVTPKPFLGGLNSTGLGPGSGSGSVGTVGVPILSAHFLCIDLLQMKSEMWIEGY